MPVVMAIPVLDGLLASEVDVDAEVLDEDGKIDLGGLSRFEEVRLGMEGAVPLPKPAICAFFGVSGPESPSET